MNGTGTGAAIASADDVAQRPVEDAAAADAGAAGCSAAAQASALQEARDRLLLATLPHVAFEGWSATAIRSGCVDAGLPVEEGAVLFPGGAREVIAHWSDWADRQMLLALDRPDFAALRMRDRIASAIHARIDVNGPWREAVRRSLAYLALPANVGTGLTCTWKTVDTIWYACGDTATDIGFYSKRASLAAVWTATVLYWLDDSSEDGAGTRAFLERRIDDVMRLPRLASRVRGGLSSLLSPLPFRKRKTAGH